MLTAASRFPRADETNAVPRRSNVTAPERNLNGPTMLPAFRRPSSRIVAYYFAHPKGHKAAAASSKSSRAGALGGELSGDPIKGKGHGAS